MAKQGNLTKHHIKPRSRFAPGEDVDAGNIVEWHESFHVHYHALFHNLTLEEAIALLRKVSEPGGTWNGRQIQQLRNYLRKEKS